VQWLSLDSTTPGCSVSPKPASTMVERLTRDWAGRAAILRVDGNFFTAANYCATLYHAPTIAALARLSYGGYILAALECVPG
jgi:hypothetical protein